MKKAILVGFAAMAFAAFAENPPPYENYVTLTNSDETSASFTGAGYWSDGLTPHPDASYYVPAGKQLSCKTNKLTWPGGPLVLAGTFYEYVGSSTGNRSKIADLTVLDDSILWFDAVYAGFQAGNLTVLAAEDHPCLVKLTSTVDYSAGRYNVWSLTVSGGPETGLSFSSTVAPTKPAARLQISSNYFKNFLGTLTVEGWMSFYYGGTTAYTDFGGKVIVGNGATFDMGSGAVKTAANVAALEVQDGGTLDLGYNAGTAREVLAVTNSMKLAAGATVVLDGLACTDKNGIAAMAQLDSTGRRIRAKAAVLSGDAVANSEISAAKVKLLDFDADPFWKESFGETLTTCEDGENGTKIVYAGFTNDNFAVNVAKDADSIDDPSLWAGGVCPVAGNDIIYTVSGSLGLRKNHEDILPYSRVVLAGNVPGDITSVATDLNFKSLDVIGGIADIGVRNVSVATGRRLRGGPLTIHDGATLRLRPWQFEFYRRNAIIEQEIRGNGTLDIIPYIGSYPTSNRVDLVNVNRDWHGRFLFQLNCYDRDYYNTEVTNALCWGGTFLADTNTYSAVTISNSPCVHVPNDVCFNEPTRGFFLNDTPRFSVEGGAKLTLSNQVTYAGIVEKDGEGVLNLGGTARFEDGQAETAPVDGRCGLVVSAGALEVSSREACDGLQVSFAEGTKLVVGKDCGFYNVKSANPLTIADEKLPVEIAGFAAQPLQDTEVTVLTLSEAAAANIGTEKFAFLSTKACQVTGFEKRPAVDGKVDYVAKIAGYKGLYLLFK